MNGCPSHSSRPNLCCQRTPGVKMASLLYSIWEPCGHRHRCPFQVGRKCRIATGMIGMGQRAEMKLHTCNCHPTAGRWLQMCLLDRMQRRNIKSLYGNSCLYLLICALLLNCYEQSWWIAFMLFEQLYCSSTAGQAMPPRPNKKRLLDTTKTRLGDVPSMLELIFTFALWNGHECPWMPHCQGKCVWMNAPVRSDSSFLNDSTTV